VRVAVRVNRPPLSSGLIRSIQGKNLTYYSQPGLANKAPLKILLVEDNKIDARLTRHAFQQISDWPSTIEVVDDGEKALRFLRRQRSYEQAERPDLVILDLNLPKYDGTEVLQVIRSSAELEDLMVFIFSSSPVDVAEERMQNANVSADCYFEKPSEVGSYFLIAAEIRERYLLATGGRRSATA